MEEEERFRHELAEIEAKYSEKMKEIDSKEKRRSNNGDKEKVISKGGRTSWLSHVRCLNASLECAATKTNNHEKFWCSVLLYVCRRWCHHFCCRCKFQGLLHMYYVSLAADLCILKHIILISWGPVTLNPFIFLIAWFWHCVQATNKA